MVCGQMDSLQQHTEYRYTTQRSQQQAHKQSALHDFLVADANNKGWARMGWYRNWDYYRLFMTTTDFRYVVVTIGPVLSTMFEVETVLKRNFN